MQKVFFLVVSFIFFVFSIPGSYAGEDVILGKGNFYNPPGKTSRIMAKGKYIEILQKGLDAISYEWELYFKFVDSEEDAPFASPLVLETTGTGKFFDSSIATSNWTIKNPDTNESISGSLSTFPSVLSLEPSITIAREIEIFDIYLYDYYQGPMSIVLNHPQLGVLTLDVCLKAAYNADTDVLAEYTIVTPDGSCGSAPYGTLWGDGDVDWALRAETADDPTTPNEDEDTTSGTVNTSPTPSSGSDDGGSCFISHLR